MEIMKRFIFLVIENSGNGEVVMNRRNYGKDMHELMTELYPLCRSITGDGVRGTLNILKKYLPSLKCYEVPTGTEVYDWIIPKEWRVTEAWLKYKDSDEKIIDYKDLNLHLLNYSRPYKGIVSYDILKEHCFTLEEHPDWIPYRTAYYSEMWGFCLSYSVFSRLDRNREYEVYIDTEMFDGSLTYGEAYIEGEGQTDKEILISTYLCHPSLCNDNLSGVVLATQLAQILSLRSDLRYSYRFIFVPETIGAIAWLATNEGKFKHIKGGLVATCVGDGAPFVYKKTREGNQEIDHIVEKVLVDSGKQFRIMDYYPGGSDERQYGSPGINLPIGSLVRGLYTTDTIPSSPFEEYHTSADNLSFVKAEYLQESLEVYLAIIKYIEKNKKYCSQNKKGEPFLAKRNLNLAVGSGKDVYYVDVAIRFLMCYSDGTNDLVEIARKARINFEEILAVSKILEDVGLLVKCEEYQNV